MNSVNKAIRKKDAMELLLGKPVYTDDIAPKDCLVVKLLRSPYANAFVKNINTDIAMKVPGIEAIFTYKDVDQNMKDSHVQVRHILSQVLMTGLFLISM